MQLPRPVTSVTLVVPSATATVTNVDEITPPEPPSRPSVTVDIPVLRFCGPPNGESLPESSSLVTSINPTCPINHNEWRGRCNATTVCSLNSWDVVKSPNLINWLPPNLAPRLNEIYDCVQPVFAPSSPCPVDKTTTASDTNCQWSWSNSFSDEMGIDIGWPNHELVRQIMRDIISKFFIGAPEHIYPHKPPDDDISLCKLVMMSYVTWKIYIYESTAHQHRKSPRSPAFISGSHCSSLDNTATDIAVSLCELRNSRSKAWPRSNLIVQSEDSVQWICLLFVSWQPTIDG